MTNLEIEAHTSTEMTKIMILIEDHKSYFHCTPLSTHQEKIFYKST